MVQAKAVEAVARLLDSRSLASSAPKLRAAAMACLAQISSRGGELAAGVALQKNLLPAVLRELIDAQSPVCRHAAAGLVAQMSQWTPELAKVLFRGLSQ